jgi:hypothetical protein
MHINKSTRVSESLQEEMAEFGLLRSKVMENAPPKESGEPNFFGVRNYGGDRIELKFDTSIEAMQDDNMTVALAAPDLETFNMLVTTNFDEAVKTGSKEDIRSYLRRIVDKA